MSRLSLLDIEYLNFLQLIPKERTRLYGTREDALDTLRKFTKQDFGDDAEAWKEWIIRNPTSRLPEILESPAEMLFDTDDPE